MFAGAEIAIVSLRPHPAGSSSSTRSAWAPKTLAGLRAQPERLLRRPDPRSPVVGTTAAAFGGATHGRAHRAAAAVGCRSSARDSVVALGVVVALVSFFSLVLGELVPKSLALRAGEGYALVIAKPLRALSASRRRSSGC